MLNLAKRINWEFVTACGLVALFWTAVIWRVAGAFNG